LGNVAGEQALNQRKLARQIGISVGLVNALVHRAVHKGLIKIKEAPARRYAYYLTPKGFAEKSRLVAEYLEVSLRFSAPPARNMTRNLPAAKRQASFVSYCAAQANLPRLRRWPPTGLRSS
jgi:DNA-binding MarR family transcriptional regulator